MGVPIDQCTATVKVGRHDQWEPRCTLMEGHEGPHQGLVDDPVNHPHSTFQIVWHRVRVIKHPRK